MRPADHGRYLLSLWGGGGGFIQQVVLENPRLFRTEEDPVRKIAVSM